MMRHPNPRVLEMTSMNKVLKRRGVAIEWRPLLGVWDVFRYCDATAPMWNVAQFMMTTPKGRSDDWFEVCCYALSPKSRRTK